MNYLSLKQDQHVSDGRTKYGSFAPNKPQHWPWQDIFLFYCENENCRRRFGNRFPIVVPTYLWCRACPSHLSNQTHTHTHTHTHTQPLPHLYIFMYTLVDIDKKPQDFSPPLWTSAGWKNCDCFALCSIFVFLTLPEGFFSTPLMMISILWGEFPHWFRFLLMFTLEDF